MARTARKVHRQHHILHEAERGQQLERLEDDADGLPAPLRRFLRAEAMHRRAIHPDFAAGCAIQPGEDVDERRLARAGFAGDNEELALPHVQTNAFEGDDCPGQSAVFLNDIF